MFVTTAIVGLRRRNEPSDSSASATISSPLPSRACERSEPTRPPTTIVGSSPPSSRTAAIIEVVVVFPCEPATAMPYFIRISSASISARGMIGIPRRRASRTSTFSPEIAEDVTTTSALRTLPGAWPARIRAPSVLRRLTVSPLARSDPVTA